MWSTIIDINVSLVRSYLCSSGAKKASFRNVPSFLTWTEHERAPLEADAARICSSCCCCGWLGFGCGCGCGCVGWCCCCRDLFERMLTRDSLKRIGRVSSTLCKAISTAFFSTWIYIFDPSITKISSKQQKCGNKPFSFAICIQFSSRTGWSPPMLAYCSRR